MIAAPLFGRGRIVGVDEDRKRFDASWTDKAHGE
jgi:hypothetical protein